MYEVWRVACDVWRVACGVWRVTCDVWRVMCNVCARFNVNTRVAEGWRPIVTLGSGQSFRHISHFPV